MARARSHGGDQYHVEQEEAIVVVDVDDRFNHLPDDILHHILSFIGDTKSAVQTSVLSRRWRYLWKDVPALHLRAESFPARERFETFLCNLLSLRSRHATLHTISFDYRKNESTWSVIENAHVYELVYMVLALGYASASLRVLSISHCSHCTATSVARHRLVVHHELSLETLELAECSLVGLSKIGTSFGATMLTSLELRGCILVFGEDDDPFANLPRLKWLRILNCTTTSSAGLKVTGLELVTLRVTNSITIRELLAPRLESFCYSSHMALLVKLVPLNLLPSLGRASVRLTHMGVPSDEQARAVTSLLRGLRNAKSLDLCFEDTSWSTPRSAFIKTMKPKIKKEISQFTRLKTLRIQSLPN